VTSTLRPISPPVSTVSEPKHSAIPHSRFSTTASRDGTLEVTAAYDVDLVKSPSNRDFRRRTNDLIPHVSRRFCGCPEPRYVPPARLSRTTRDRPRSVPEPLPLPASCCEWMARRLRFTGIVMLRSRGISIAAPITRLGQFDKAEDVFGASGAAALYAMKAPRGRRHRWPVLLTKTSSLPRDADLAWRCRLLGWTSFIRRVRSPYTAVGSRRNGRGIARVDQLPFREKPVLLRIKNMTRACTAAISGRLRGETAAVIDMCFSANGGQFPLCSNVLRRLSA